MEIQKSLSFENAGKPASSQPNFKAATSLYNKFFVSKLRKKVNFRGDF